MINISALLINYENSCCVFELRRNTGSVNICYFFDTYTGTVRQHKVESHINIYNIQCYQLDAFRVNLELERQILIWQKNQYKHRTTIHSTVNKYIFLFFMKFRYTINQLLQSIIFFCPSLALLPAPTYSPSADTHRVWSSSNVRTIYF